MVVVDKIAIANIAPDEARRSLERTCDRVKLRANSNGKCFGGEMMDSVREAVMKSEANHIEILETRSLLVHSTELRGEEYPAEILQDRDHRIPLSTASRFLNDARERIKNQGN